MADPEGDDEPAAVITMYASLIVTIHTDYINQMCA